MFFKVTVCNNIFSKAQRFLHSCINKQNQSNHSFYIMTFSCQWTYISSRFNVSSYLQLSCSIHKTGRFWRFYIFHLLTEGNLKSALHLCLDRISFFVHCMYADHQLHELQLKFKTIRIRTRFTVISYWPRWLRYL